MACLKSQGVPPGKPISMSEGETLMHCLSARGEERELVESPPAGRPAGAADQMPAAPCRLMPDVVPAACSPLRVSAPSLPMA